MKIIFLMIVILYAPMFTAISVIILGMETASYIATITEKVK